VHLQVATDIITELTYKLNKSKLRYSRICEN